jgi:cbb3-type cytochrome oxidase subunit 3
MFLAVVAYAAWPGNKARFETIQRKALGLDQQTSDAERGRK